jgi:hypothetical protein
LQGHLSIDFLFLIAGLMYLVVAEEWLVTRSLYAPPLFVDPLQEQQVVLG